MSRYFGWRPYVPVAERRAKAARELAKKEKKSGRKPEPVLTVGRQIASSFWGRAWCENLESYSDFENRLPRGRTYVRNGSVVDLTIAQGSIRALVSGSELYRVEIEIQRVPAKRWEAIRKDCAGKIDSLLELLQGRLSTPVMQYVTRQDQGLFPSPREIGMKCSCPDWAEMCKHVAATLYGVGTRLDTRPELLFHLRGVDPGELIAEATVADAVRATTADTAAVGLSGEDLSAVFGIDLEPGPARKVGAPSKPGPARVLKAGKAAKVPPAPRSKPKPKSKSKAKAARKPVAKAASSLSPEAPAKRAPARRRPIPKPGR